MNKAFFKRAVTYWTPVHCHSINITKSYRVKEPQWNQVFRLQPGLGWAPRTDIPDICRQIAQEEPNSFLKSGLVKVNLCCIAQEPANRVMDKTFKQTEEITWNPHQRQTQLRRGTKGICEQLRTYSRTKYIFSMCKFLILKTFSKHKMVE